LLRNLSLLDIPDSGELQIFDKLLNFPLLPNQNNYLPYPKLTVVFQQLFLWPHLTNKKNILLALDKKSTSYQHNLNYFDELVGVHEVSNFIPSIKIFPNPATDQLQINFPAFDFWRIEIFDQLGLKVLNFNSGFINQHNQSIALASGVYVIRITSQNKNYSQKIIIN
ncbi:MAG: T9SS type A sorting domain-containing protein, partial [Chitinophagales bacterium]|nr:T9SS type A sorting domain-containing protein [Chitinophagales bacterium]